MTILSIKGLHVSVENNEIVRGVDLTMNQGEIHAVMGPNGSGKSTLVHALMGHPACEITKGSVKFFGKDLLKMEPHDRSLAGLFLAFQYPKDIAGVTLRSFLFAAYSARQEKKSSPLKFREYLKEKMSLLDMAPAFSERYVNQGFSGGEKKKAEILQMHVLQPKLALLDETDSGLDVDALKIVSEGVNAMRSHDFSALIVTHYARILEHITPDHVHVMVDGRIVESGGADLANQLEKEGYANHKSSFPMAKCTG